MSEYSNPEESRTLVKQALLKAFDRYLAREGMHSEDSWRAASFGELFRHLQEEVEEVREAMSGAVRWGKVDYELIDVMAMAAICLAKRDLIRINRFGESVEDVPA